MRCDAVRTFSSTRAPRLSTTLMPVHYFSGCRSTRHRGRRARPPPPAPATTGGRRRRRRQRTTTGGGRRGGCVSTGGTTKTTIVVCRTTTTRRTTHTTVLVRVSRLRPGPITLSVFGLCVTEVTVLVSCRRRRP